MAGPTTAKRVLPTLSPAAKPRVLATPPTGGHPYQESTEACLARTAPVGHGDLSLEELKRQLDRDEKAFERLAKTAEEQHELKVEWLSDMRKAAQDVAWTSIDQGADGMRESTGEALEETEDELGAKIVEKVDKVKALREQAVKDGEEMAAAGADPARIAALRQQTEELRGEAQSLIEEGQDLAKTRSRLEGANRTVEEFKQTRDFMNWITDMDGPDKFGESNPLAESENGDINPGLEGARQLLMFGVKAAWEGTPIGEAVEAADMTINLSYDTMVGYFGYQQLQQMKQNDAGFAKGKAMLARRIDRLNAEIGCYQSADQNNEAAR